MLYRTQRTQELDDGWYGAQDVRPVIGIDHPRKDRGAGHNPGEAPRRVLTDLNSAANCIRLDLEFIAEPAMNSYDPKP